MLGVRLEVGGSIGSNECIDGMHVLEKQLQLLYRVWVQILAASFRSCQVFCSGIWCNVVQAVSFWFTVVFGPGHSYAMGRRLIGSKKSAARLLDSEKGAAGMDPNANEGSTCPPPSPLFGSNPQFFFYNKCPQYPFFFSVFFLLTCSSRAVTVAAAAAAAIRWCC
jgi:hypothetical protein